MDGGAIVIKTKFKFIKTYKTDAWLDREPKVKRIYSMTLTCTVTGAEEFYPEIFMDHFCEEDHKRLVNEFKVKAFANHMGM